MSFGVLERLLVTERHRQRLNPRYQVSTLSPSDDDGFVVPGLMERKMGVDEGPFFVTNARGTFLQTRRSEKTGDVRYGFSKIPVGQDDQLLPELFRTLWDLSEREGWKNRCTSMQGAINRMGAFGVEPSSLVLGYSQVKEAVGQDFDREAVDKAMAVKGHLTTIGEMKVRVTDMPDGCAMLFTGPPLVGFYTRIGDHLGVLLRGVNQSIVLVRNDVA